MSADLPLNQKLTLLLAEFRKQFTSLLETSLVLTRDSTKTVVRVAKPNSTDNSEPSPVDIVNKLLVLDGEFKALLEEVKYHQQLQKQIHRVRAATAEQNQLILKLVLQLTQTRDGLLNFIRGAESQLESIEKASSNPIDYDEIIPYANKLSTYTAAPPNFDPSAGAVPAETPYPVEGTMRAGLLNQKRKLTVATPLMEKEKAPTLAIDAELMSTFMAHHEHNHTEDFDFLDLDLNPDLE
ncbi:hypothetical protein H4R33_005496 [Dimargaris cristalligena]|uniref:Mediator of RNA polymerase II transcription subunit 4 n=1 Tax=Dimargaris cristalligena TaxID=215637 RepID=A0A4P9ZVZ1_9FUNG|nr:hypothetical protein H4R33_005496 [Dimargaris cristalligena]RKP37022.1 vitamin-D-receptor interacting mediator subunit 4-domain-containing protein [Dimargaris cristalligena]|eukprot:RKP37022.1 vitamin-D-receptor interacting mediator subunit 4-domain-containing protein [Dimargaris cristalligena]